MIDFDTRRPLFKNARLTSLTRYLGERKKGKSGKRGTRGTGGRGEQGGVNFSSTGCPFHFFPRRLLPPNGEFTSQSITGKKVQESLEERNTQDQSKIFGILDFLVALKPALKLGLAFLFSLKSGCQTYLRQSSHGWREATIRQSAFVKNLFHYHYCSPFRE